VFFFLLLLRRSVAVELEVVKELNKLLYSVETMYLSIVREVAEYAIANNVMNSTQPNSKGCSTVSIGKSTQALIHN